MLQDALAKGTIVVSLANEIRKQAVRETLVKLVEDVKKDPGRSQDYIENLLPQVIEAASIVPVASALAKGFGNEILERFSSAK
jgi:hypothetical protein